MASKQDSPTRKKQKVRATRKLAIWREKQAQAAETTSAAAAAKK